MNKSVFYSTLFGIGNLPYAPGTWGSIVAFIVYLILPKSWFSTLSGQLFFFKTILLLSLISAYFVTKAEAELGHDHESIVIDEFYGYLISISLFPKSLLAGLLGLVLFRIFDIFKPEPINSLQRLPKGLGVMVDDLAAGLFSNISLHVIFFGMNILNLIKK
jgi:phosphatidylglycerophosphatase A